MMCSMHPMLACASQPSPWAAVGGRWPRRVQPTTVHRRGGIVRKTTLTNNTASQPASPGPGRPQDPAVGSSVLHGTRRRGAGNQARARLTRARCVRNLTTEGWGSHGASAAGAPPPAPCSLLPAPCHARHAWMDMAPNFSPSPPSERRRLLALAPLR